MVGWQSPQYDPGQQQRGAATPGQASGQFWQQPQPDEQPQYGQQQYGQPQYQQVQPYARQQPVAVVRKQYAVGLTGAQQVWYVLQCIAFGAGYFAKLPTAKALSEMPQFQAGAYR